MAARQPAPRRPLRRRPRFKAHTLAALSFDAETLAPVLLSCADQGPWRDFNSLLHRFAATVNADCGSQPSLAGSALRRAAELLDFFKPAWEEDFRPADFFAACCVPERRGTFCLPGYVNALACAARVLLDLRHCGWELSVAVELEAAESPALRSLLARGALSVAPDLLRMLQLPTLPLLFLDSSPWPFGLANVSELLAKTSGDWRYGAWREPQGGGLWTVLRPPLSEPWPRRGPAFGLEPVHVRVWSFGLHATLAMEPESVWEALISPLGPWKVTVVSVLAQNYCELGGGCTQHAFNQLLERHVIKSARAVNQVNKFPHVPDPEGLSREFHSIARNDAAIVQADVLMCSEPPFFCTLFLGLGKAVFGYFGNPFGAYLLPGGPQELFYARFHDELAADPRNTIACMSPSNSALIYWHSGVHVPTVRPLGLYTRATYRPTLDDVLVTKRMFSFWDVACVLNDFASALQAHSPRYNGTRFVRLLDLRDKSWANWARHRAAVFLPYETMQMVFYELYGMGVPLLVPAPELLPLMTRFGYISLQEFEHRRPGWEAPVELMAYNWTEKAAQWELRWWTSISDLARAPHLLRWSSAPQLLRKLLLSDLEEVAAGMRRVTERQLVASVDFWRDAFARALAGAP